MQSDDKSTHAKWLKELAVTALRAGKDKPIIAVIAKRPVCMHA
jgi:hypothetical protein